MKNYKILRINGVFHDLLIKDIIKKSDKFVSVSYNDVLEQYAKNSFVYSFSFTNELRKLGNEAIEILVDFKDLQILWAKENDFYFDPDNWAGEILFEQIKRTKPDIIFFQSHHFLHISRLFKFKSSLNTIQLIKSKFSFVKKIIVYSGYPTDHKLVTGADIIFFSPPSIKNYFNKAGIKSYLMYHFFDERILDKIKNINSNEKYEVTFAGSSRYPETRYFFLSSILKDFDLFDLFHHLQ